MPFVPALRLQLKHLKEEFDAGIIPNVVYEEMCRNAIKQYTMSSPGENEIFADDADSFVLDDAPSKRRSVSSINNLKVDTNIEANQSEDRIAKAYETGNVYIKHEFSIDGRPCIGGEVSKPVTSFDHINLDNEHESDASLTSNGEKIIIARPVFRREDDTRVNQVDRRKFNRGQKNRKSYSKDIKERSIALRANGLSVEEIAKILDTAKSNIEKWCSYKCREKILARKNDVTSGISIMRANRQTSGSASQAPGPSHVLRDSMSHNIPTYVSNQMELGEVYNDEEDELDEFEENEDRAAVEAAQIARLRELERNSVSSLYALKGPSDPGMWCNTGGYNGISSFPPQLPNHHHHSMNMSHSSFVDHNDSMKNFKLNGNALFSKPYQIPNRSTQPMPHLSSHLSTSDHYFRMTLSDMARIGLPMPARVSSSHSGNASAMGHSSHKNPYHSNPSAIAAPQPQPQLQHQYPPHSTQADTSINTSTIDDTQEKEKIIYARIDMSKPATQKSPVSKPVVSTAPSRQYCDPALQVAPAFGFLMPYSHPPINPSSQAANYPKMRLYSVNDDQGFYDKASAEGQSPEPSKSVLIESADARILKLHNWAKISDMPDYYCSTGIVTANDTSSATELQTRESLNEITPSATIELNKEALGNESNNKRLRGLEPDSENGVLFSTSDSWVSEEPNQYEPVVTESSIEAVHNDYKCSNVTKKRSVR